MTAVELKLSKKNKAYVYFAINRNSAVLISVAAILLLLLYSVINADFPQNLMSISLGINFLLLVGIILLCTVYKLENLTKDRALRIIATISRVKLSVVSICDLVKLICKKLECELGGKFWVILAEHNQNLEMDESYRENALRVLKNMVPLTIRYFDKIIYFQPLHINDKIIGVLIAEIQSRHEFNFTLQKILPHQISLMINNFQTVVKLQKANVAQERENLRSLILSSISHDLKTPLSSIIAGLRVFNVLSSKNKLDEKSKKILINTALEEAERLNEFISEILEMTRIESGAITLNKQLLEAAVVMEKVCKRFEQKLRDYKIEINFGEKVKINFDQTSCEQVFQNLIDNTIKYSPKKSKISIWDKLKNDSYFIFIKDEGVGINPSKLNLIFNKFERFSLKDKVVGSGLGLSIVKALMEANDASIIAQNVENEIGAIFVLRFKDFTKN